MKVVFFGTPEFVVPVVEALDKKYNTAREHNLIAVVTQPPSITGREKKREHSPVDNWAFKKKITIVTQINEVPEADLGVCAAYGAIIPQSVIDKFHYGILNIHPSLLPKYRGASPIQTAIAAGETETGVTIIKMDKELDHGPIVSRFKEPISAEDTNESLRRRLFLRASEFLIDPSKAEAGLIPSYLSGKVKPKEQDHAHASFCKIITKADGFIDPTFISSALEGKTKEIEWQINFIKDYSQKPTPENLERFIRAMNPWPIAWTNINLTGEAGSAMPKRLKILSAHVDEGKLVLEQVQLEGKNDVSWKQFKAGYKSASFD